MNRNKIIKKTKLSNDVYQMEIDAPLIAEERKAGQFIVLLIDLEHGERIPLTIAGADKKKGTITIIFQTVGDTTKLLAQKKEGDFIESLLGPLGTETHIQKYDKPVVCVGGGIGVAPLRPIVQAFKEAGNEVISIIGARNKDLLILEDEIREYSDQVIICTDDGSYGRKDLVTAPLKELCESENPPAEVIAIGPPIMMKFCAQTTKPYNIHTTVSLNTIMIDGTGMCGGCRVTVGDEVKFVCVDGPEFDGHKVDFDNMMNRLNTYKFQDAHDCNIGLDKK
ncbi:MAG: sulfide/dihydroorotate dehydrogenase-like FAD/NAD-binding protein [Spirochaetaceae bacterium]|nr:sulfide/dihydroorotate dehydrogenase-like FAD/NAD-binding protein [Spirochaetaceae bacterium]